MRLIHSLQATTKTRIGRGGLSAGALASANKAVARAVGRLQADFAAERLPLLTLPTERRDIRAIREAAAKFGSGARDIVFLGTGGSSLGGQTLCQLADYGVPGLGRLAEGPRLHFMDNLDPATYAAFLERLPLKTARFVAISKSGGTGETLLQVAAAIAAYRRAGAKGSLGKYFLGLSEPAPAGKRNGLRALLKPEGATFLDHHTGIGGRYSVLSNVGLLAAAFAGLDIAAIRRGAAEALKPLLNKRLALRAPAAAGAALNLAAMRQGKGIAVMMGYGDRFEKLTRWWVQLWAESLGKAGKGSQPVAALGPVDQHSQQQLYLAGPRDKIFTILTVENAGVGTRIDSALAERAGEPGFGGKTIGDFVTAQSRAMIDTFARNGCPVRHIHMKRLDEAAMGELLMHFMLETILTGYAMRINPFDQPAVEEAKVLAKTYLLAKAKRPGKRRKSGRN